MPEYRCPPIPQSFLGTREITREFTPREFLDFYSHLEQIIITVQSDLQDLLYFRGWSNIGSSSSGPECRMRKTFPSAATVETSAKIALEIEAMICAIPQAHTAKVPPSKAG
jgi:hypothetical protein